MHRFARALLLVVTLGILCSGPVAACVCPDGGMPAMPCCPDQHPHGGDVALMPHSLDLACDSVPAQLLPATSSELPIFIGIATSAPSPFTRGPRASERAAPFPAPNPPPIYLTTLRLRI